MNQMAKKNYLKDYKAPSYQALKTKLTFDLFDDFALVTAEVSYKRQECAPENALLELNGHGLELLKLKVDGIERKLEQLDYSPQHLNLDNLPEDFSLFIETRIYPSKNTALEGLYRSGRKFCTQCEPEGFRRITYFLDRPDVMSEFTTTIIADKTSYPILLSNGNLIGEETLDHNRHKKIWHDPFPKPSYLFALVAGDLAMEEDYYETMSGRKVSLRIFVEKENHDKCAFAMRSIKDAMKWDEEVYGLEYDLDIFMVVAVSDFNMGAMENKGLNIFNAKYVLASPDTATDKDFENIQCVVGHEYFHNWSGNRVTCRDWFQLCLKEGLTVFRDQEFSADMNSRAVTRIDSVQELRNRQFPEDSGPMAHPVRPDCYIEINNFYTATVYLKGPEIIRMIAIILGEENYYKGISLYFKRHDGQAVTVEDFIKAMEDASGKDLSGFKLWYSQAGTPTICISSKYDKHLKTYTLDVSQSTPYIAGQNQLQPFTIPIKVALFSEEGHMLSCTLEGQKQREHTLLLKKQSQQFVFQDVQENVIPSLLRNFSAPVYLKYDYSDEQLVKLFQFDNDPFNQWESMQSLALSFIDQKRANSQFKIASHFFSSIENFIRNETIDARLRSRALLLPDMDYLMTLEGGDVNIDMIWDARQWLLGQISTNCKAAFFDVFQSCQQSVFEDQLSPPAVAQRELKALCLSYLLHEPSQDIIDLVVNAYRASKNMTDTSNCLTLIADIDCKERKTLLDDFYQKWKHDPLVLDKWFLIQASSAHPHVLGHVKDLIQHPDFDFSNPNRVYSVLRCFRRILPHGLHSINGEGYRLLRENIVKIDNKNPQVAAILSAPFSQWQNFDKTRQGLMLTELRHIAGHKGLSKDVFEIVNRSLETA